VRAAGNGETCYIGKLFVHPDSQNKGIGAQLMDEIERMFEGAKRYELATGHLSVKNLYFCNKRGYKRFKPERLTESLDFVFLEMLPRK
jgi:GNAT superfamily N-acetyltransferase